MEKPDMTIYELPNLQVQEFNSYNDVENYINRVKTLT